MRNKSIFTARTHLCRVIVAAVGEQVGTARRFTRSDLTEKTDPRYRHREASQVPILLNCS